MEQYNVLDLFCGCGGMSWGLAKKGFNIIAGIDIWDIALKTYQHNHKGCQFRYYRCFPARGYE
jgi:DNA (cytosine-5)-methyltransferase 1